ncbi:MAG: zinc-ribbon domain containing protein [Pseudomonadota bacterium]
MQHEDLEMTCVECGDGFVFTRTEKQQWAKRGFVHTPKRCRRCREERRKRQKNSYPSNDQYSVQNIYRAPAFQNEQQWKSSYRSPMERPARRDYEITCSKCGEKDRIPFRPSPGRDVFCHACYEEIKKSGYKKKPDKDMEKGKEKEVHREKETDMLSEQMESGGGEE